MNALILAAGDGTRLIPLTRTVPKVMIKIWGVPILERVLFSLKEAGVTRAVIVTGYKEEAITQYFGSSWHGMEIVYRRNEWWGDGILTSVVKAKDAITNRFILLCGDTILEPSTIRRLIQVRGDIVVGTRERPAEESVVASVRDDGTVEKIGMLQQMPSWNRIVTGISVCEPAFFDAVEATLLGGSADRPDAIQRMIEEGCFVKSFDMTQDTWLEIDTHEDLENAGRALFERAWKQRLSPGQRTTFRRVFNLPISLRLTKIAARTSIRPNHLTIISMATALLAGCLFSFEMFVLGGVFSYLCALFDAVDGKIARLKCKTSLWGKVLDSVTDRISEAAIVFGLTIGLFKQGFGIGAIGLGFLAFCGWMGSFYLKELFTVEVGGKRSVWKTFRLWKILLGGDRDVSFFATLCFCIAGFPLLALCWMALFGNVIWAIRIAQVRRHLIFSEGVVSGIPAKSLEKISSCEAMVDTGQSPSEGVSCAHAGLRNAAIVASPLITTEAMVVEKPEKKEKMPYMPPGGGGMY